MLFILMTGEGLCAEHANQATPQSVEEKLAKDKPWATSHELYVYREMTSLVSNYQRKEPYALDHLMEVFSDDPRGILGNLFIVNWVFDSKNIKCSDKLAKDLVKKLKQIIELRFTYGVDFYCDPDSFSKQDNIRTPIQLREIK